MNENAGWVRGFNVHHEWRTTRSECRVALPVIIGPLTDVGGRCHFCVRSFTCNQPYRMQDSLVPHKAVPLKYVTVELRVACRFT